VSTIHRHSGAIPRAAASLLRKEITSTRKNSSDMDNALSAQEWNGESSEEATCEKRWEYYADN